MAKPIRTRKIKHDPTKNFEQRKREGIRRWADFYRQNPQYLISTFFGCTSLTWWQDMIIYMIFKSSKYYLIACRGIGKSYLLAWAMLCQCVAYPRSRIVLASGTRGQAALLVKQKLLGELYNAYPRVRSVINMRDTKISVNETVVKFWNGSEIVCVVSSDNSRGNRCCWLCLEESRTIDKDIKENVLERFKNNGSRKARYNQRTKYERYTAPEDTPKTIQITSGWFENHWLYPEVMAAFDNMLDGGTEHALSLSWIFPCIDNFFSIDSIEAEMRSPNYTNLFWNLEMNGLFSNLSESSIYSYDDVSKCMTLENIVKDIPHECYLDKKLMSDWKKSNPFIKEQGELRVLSLDVALRGGSKSDNSVATLLCGKPNDANDRYNIQVPYIKHYNNTHSEELALEMKRKYYQWDVDVITIDVNGLGNSVSQAMSKKQYDTLRDVWYPPMTVFNRDDLKNSIFNSEISDATPAIYAVIQNPKMNHDLLMNVKSDLENRRLALPIPSNIAEDKYVERMEADKVSVDENKMKKYLSTHYESDLLCKELCALEVMQQKSSPYLRVENVNGMKKDRFSSLGFGVYYFHQLEGDLVKKRGKNRSGLMSLLN